MYSCSSRNSRLVPRSNRQMPTRSCKSAAVNSRKSKEFVKTHSPEVIIVLCGIELSGIESHPQRWLGMCLKS